jgi:hypothetical protein
VYKFPSIAANRMTDPGASTPVRDPDGHLWEIIQNPNDEGGA